MIINLTPHPINVYAVDCPDRIDPDAIKPEFTVPASTAPARLVENTLGTWFSDSFDQQAPAESFVTVTVEGVEYGYVTNLPEPDGQNPHQTWYLVPLVVALAARHRSDLLVPYRDVRNLTGTIVGCRQLAQPA